MSVCKDNDFEQYLNLLDKVYPKSDVRKRMLKKYSKYIGKCFYEHFGNKVIGGVFVINFGENIYGICGMVVDPKLKNMGFGSRLLEQVHKAFKGTFLLRTSGAVKFYEKNDYVIVKKFPKTTVMAYSNKKFGW